MGIVAICSLGASVPPAQNPHTHPLLLQSGCLVLTVMVVLDVHSQLSQGRKVEL